MVRLDKIIYMITCFKSLVTDLEQHQYSIPKEDLIIDKDILRVISRVGVISKKTHLKQTSKELIKSIPYGREYFLLSNTIRHSTDICTKGTPD